MASSSLYTALTLLLMAALVYSQAYRDPCRGKQCGNHGCCIRKNAYYTANGNVRYRQAACACDDDYYWHNKDRCRPKCYQHTCHRHATCKPKNRGLGYPNSKNNAIYSNDYYYCQCNKGYIGNGRNCRDPCRNSDCHKQATCSFKLYGSTDYYNYATYKGYVQSHYFCRCKKNYYGNGKQCTHKCFGHTCHQYATCKPKNIGLKYPNSAEYPIYQNDYYYCDCNRGYTGNGRYCRPKDPCHGNDCHKHATCHPKAIGSTSYYNYPEYLGYVPTSYYCKCKDFYYGNGRQCTGHCDKHSCHYTAMCVPKQYGSTNYPTYAQYPGYTNSYFYCACKPGHYWNGRRCQEDPCHNHPCHPYATCHRKTCGSIQYAGYGNFRGYANRCYYCTCNKPYSGNGILCHRFGGY